MIKSLRLVNFKNFADETLHLGPFTLIVGANASGKSNIRDALRFLHGIGRGYTIAEIMGGKFGEGSYMEWTGIRGAPSEIVRTDQEEFTLEVEMKPTWIKLADVEHIKYAIKVLSDDRSVGRFRVADEFLTAKTEDPKSIYSGTMFARERSQDGKEGVQERDETLVLYLPMAKERIEVSSDKPGFSQLNEHVEDLIFTNQMESSDTNSTPDNWPLLETDLVRAACTPELSQIRFLEFSLQRMRDPAVPGAKRLGDSGDYLPAVLEAIYADSERRETLKAWLRELTPADISDFDFPRDPSGRIHLHLREANGSRFSAYSASDGTLRFLGVLAALLDDDYGGTYLFEEIDNGIHPARLSLLVDLIERQTAKGAIQVVATTHSPGLLDLVNDTTFENTSVVYRDEHAADAVIKRVAELPNARELRKSQGLGRLHASGWMESILSFAEADKADEKGGE